jgi:hypothetical protein
MKRLLPVSLIIISIAAKAQTNTWTGGSLGNWGNVTKWSQGHIPTSGEDVIINTNCNINVNSFAGGVNAVRSLKITGGVSVKLTCSVNGVRYLRMSSTSLSSRGLQVDAGNTLIFDATNATGTGSWICDLTGATGVTGLIDGTLQFEGTGPGSGDASLNLYTGASNNANLIVSNTGKIIHMIDTGDDNGGTGSYLTMQSGSIYEQHEDGGAIPFGNWNSGSSVKLVTTGAVPPVFAGNSYGNVEINCTGLTTPLGFNKDIDVNDLNIVSSGGSSVAVTTASSAVPFTLTINGKLSVSSSSTLELAVVSSGDAGGIIRLKGNVTNNGTIRSESGSECSFEIGGSANQAISGAGAWLGNALSVVINNTSGVTLLSPWLVRFNLVFSHGNIKTDAVNILTLAKGPGYSASWTGASSASFVDGPMRNVSTGTLITFPVGKGTIYAPIGYYHLLNHQLTDTFRAEYFRANPQGVYGSSYDGTGNPEVINHISNVEYWILTSNVTSGTFLTNSIEPHISLSSFCQDISNTFTARFDPTTNKWKNAGTIARNVESAGPPFATGYIQSQYAEGGIFTLATSSANNILGVSQSTLPIHLITFDATKINSSSALVNWQLADLSSTAEKFEVQRAGNDRNFATIGMLPGKDNARFYDYTDNELKTGVNLYRVRMTDKDGKITYTRIAAVINEVKGFLLTSLLPTIVTQSTRLTVASSDKQRIDVIVMDMQGRVMLRRNFSVVAGNTNIDLSMEKLQSGAYALTAISEQGQRSTIRFIKE